MHKCDIMQRGATFIAWSSRVENFVWPGIVETVALPTMQLQTQPSPPTMRAAHCEQRHEKPRYDICELRAGREHQQADASANSYCTESPKQTSVRHGPTPRPGLLWGTGAQSRLVCNIAYACEPCGAGGRYCNQSDGCKGEMEHALQRERRHAQPVWLSGLRRSRRGDEARRRRCTGGGAREKIS